MLAMRYIKRLINFIVCAGVMYVASVSADQTLPDVVQKVKPSIVGVGIYNIMGRPKAKFRGTGFIVGNGKYVITNSHVVPELVEKDAKGYLAVFTQEKGLQKVRRAEKIARDIDHDLYLLRITGDPLPALELGDSSQVREGELYAFTGFPIGTVLGMYPATHRGIISAITPIVTPADSSYDLKQKAIRRLRSPYDVFQLDATAYPGNSGSPLYDPGTGAVVGVVNKVFVKETKEDALENPSGITYAIPVLYVHRLIKNAGLAF